MLWLNHNAVLDTGLLETSRGKWNSVCRGKIRRYTEEHQKRKQLTGEVLTLIDESVGSERD